MPLITPEQMGIAPLRKSSTAELIRPGKSFDIIGSKDHWYSNLLSGNRSYDYGLNPTTTSQQNLRYQNQGNIDWFGNNALKLGLETFVGGALSLAGGATSAVAATLASPWIMAKDDLSTSDFFVNNPILQLNRGMNNLLEHNLPGMRSEEYDKMGFFQQLSNPGQLLSENIESVGFMTQALISAGGLAYLNIGAKAATSSAKLLGKVAGKLGAVDKAEDLFKVGNSIMSNARRAERIDYLTSHAILTGVEAGAEAADASETLRQRMNEDNLRYEQAHESKRKDMKYWTKEEIDARVKEAESNVFNLNALTLALTNIPEMGLMKKFRFTNDAVSRSNKWGLRLVNGEWKDELGDMGKFGRFFMDKGNVTGQVTQSILKNILFEGTEESLQYTIQKINELDKHGLGKGGIQDYLANLGSTLDLSDPDRLKAFGLGALMSSGQVAISSAVGGGPVAAARDYKEGRSTSISELNKAKLKTLNTPDIYKMAPEKKGILSTKEVENGAGGMVTSFINTVEGKEEVVPSREAYEALVEKHKPDDKGNYTIPPVHELNANGEMVVDQTKKDSLLAEAVKMAALADIIDNEEMTAADDKLNVNQRIATRKAWAEYAKIAFNSGLAEDLLSNIDAMANESDENLTKMGITDKESYKREMTALRQYVGKLEDAHNAVEQHIIPTSRKEKYLEDFANRKYWTHKTAKDFIMYDSIVKDMEQEYAAKFDGLALPDEVKDSVEAYINLEVAKDKDGRKFDKAFEKAIRAQMMGEAVDKATKEQLKKGPTTATVEPQLGEALEYEKETALGELKKLAIKKAYMEEVREESKQALNKLMKLDTNESWYKKHKDNIHAATQPLSAFSKMMPFDEALTKETFKRWLMRNVKEKQLKLRVEAARSSVFGDYIEALLEKYSKFSSRNLEELDDSGAVEVIDPLNEELNDKEYMEFLQDLRTLVTKILEVQPILEEEVVRPLYNLIEEIAERYEIIVLDAENIKVEEGLKGDPIASNFEEFLNIIKSLTKAVDNLPNLVTGLIDVQAKIRTVEAEIDTLKNSPELRVVDRAKTDFELLMGDRDTGPQIESVRQAALDNINVLEVAAEKVRKQINNLNAIINKLNSQLQPKQRARVDKANSGKESDIISEVMTQITAIYNNAAAMAGAVELADILDFIEDIKDKSGPHDYTEIMDENFTDFNGLNYAKEKLEQLLEKVFTPDYDGPTGSLSLEQLRDLLKSHIAALEVLVDGAIFNSYQRIKQELNETRNSVSITEAILKELGFTLSVDADKKSILTGAPSTDYFTKDEADEVLSRFLKDSLAGFYYLLESLHMKGKLVDVLGNLRKYPIGVDSILNLSASFVNALSPNQKQIFKGRMSAAALASRSPFKKLKLTMLALQIIEGDPKLAEEFSNGYNIMKLGEKVNALPDGALKNLYRTAINTYWFETGLQQVSQFAKFKNHSKDKTVKGLVDAILSKLTPTDSTLPPASPAQLRLALHVAMFTGTPMSGVEKAEQFGGYMFVEAPAGTGKTYVLAPTIAAVGTTGNVLVTSPFEEPAKGLNKAIKNETPAISVVELIKILDSTNRSSLEGIDTIIIDEFAAISDTQIHQLTSKLAMYRAETSRSIKVIVMYDTNQMTKNGYASSLPVTVGADVNGAKIEALQTKATLTDVEITELNKLKANVDGKPSMGESRMFMAEDVLPISVVYRSDVAEIAYFSEKFKRSMPGEWPSGVHTPEGESGILGTMNVSSRVALVKQFRNNKALNPERSRVIIVTNETDRAAYQKELPDAEVLLVQNSNGISRDEVYIDIPDDAISAQVDRALAYYTAISRSVLFMAVIGKGSNSVDPLIKNRVKQLKDTRVDGRKAAIERIQLTSTLMSNDAVGSAESVITPPTTPPTTPPDPADTEDDSEMAEETVKAQTGTETTELTPTNKAGETENELERLVRLQEAEVKRLAKEEEERINREKQTEPLPDATDEVIDNTLANDDEEEEETEEFELEEAGLAPPTYLEYDNELPEIILRLEDGQEGEVIKINHPVSSNVGELQKPGSEDTIIILVRNDDDTFVNAWSIHKTDDRTVRFRDLGRIEDKDLSDSAKSKVIHKKGRTWGGALTKLTITKTSTDNVFTSRASFKDLEASLFNNSYRMSTASRRLTGFYNKQKVTATLSSNQDVAELALKVIEDVAGIEAAERARNTMKPDGTSDMWKIAMPKTKRRNAPDAKQTVKLVPHLMVKFIPDAKSFNFAVRLQSTQMDPSGADMNLLNKGVQMLEELETLLGSTAAFKHVKLGIPWEVRPTGARSDSAPTEKFHLYGRILTILAQDKSAPLEKDLIPRLRKSLIKSVDGVDTSLVTFEGKPVSVEDIDAFLNGLNEDNQTTKRLRELSKEIYRELHGVMKEGDKSYFQGPLSTLFRDIVSQNRVLYTAYGGFSYRTYKKAGSTDKYNPTAVPIVGPISAFRTSFSKNSSKKKEGEKASEAPLLSNNPIVYGPKKPSGYKKNLEAALKRLVAIGKGNSSQAVAIREQLRVIETGANIEAQIPTIQSLKDIVAHNQVSDFGIRTPIKRTGEGKDATITPTREMRLQTTFVGATPTQAWIHTPGTTIVPSTPSPKVDTSIEKSVFESEMESLMKAHLLTVGASEFTRKEINSFVNSLKDNPSYDGLSVDQVINIALSFGFMPSFFFNLGGLATRLGRESISQSIDTFFGNVFSALETNDDISFNIFAKVATLSAVLQNTKSIEDITALVDRAFKFGGQTADQSANSPSALSNIFKAAGINTPMLAKLKEILIGLASNEIVFTLSREFLPQDEMDRFEFWKKAIQGNGNQTLEIISLYELAGKLFSLYHHVNKKGTEEQKAAMQKVFLGNTISPAPTVPNVSVLPATEDSPVTIAPTVGTMSSKILTSIKGKVEDYKKKNLPLSLNPEENLFATAAAKRGGFDNLNDMLASDMDEINEVLDEHEQATKPKKWRKSGFDEDLGETITYEEALRIKDKMIRPSLFEWLRRIFSNRKDPRFRFVSFAELKHIAGDDVWGVFKNGIIYIGTEDGRVGAKVVKHELVHMVINQYLTPVERQMLFEVAKKEIPNAALLEGDALEEAIVEKYFDKRKERGLLKVIFDMIKNLFRFLYNNINTLEDFFNSIDDGSYSGKPKYSFLGQRNMLNISELFPSKALRPSAVFEAATEALISEVNKQDVSDGILSYNERLAAAVTKLMKDSKIARSSIKSVREISKQTDPKLAALMYLANDDKMEAFVRYYFPSLTVNFTEQTIQNINKAEGIKDEAKRQIALTNAILQGEIENEELVDPKSRMTERVKTYFANIRYDENGEDRLVPFSVAFNTLLENLNLLNPTSLEGLLDQVETRIAKLFDSKDVRKQAIADRVIDLVNTIRAGVEENKQSRIRFYKTNAYNTEYALVSTTSDPLPEDLTHDQVTRENTPNVRVVVRPEGVSTQQWAEDVKKEHNIELTEFESSYQFFDNINIFRGLTITLGSLREITMVKGVTKYKKGKLLLTYRPWSGSKVVDTNRGVIKNIFINHLIDRWYNRRPEFSEEWKQQTINAILEKNKGYSAVAMEKMSYDEIADLYNSLSNIRNSSETAFGFSSANITQENVNTILRSIGLATLKTVSERELMVTGLREISELYDTLTDTSSLEYSLKEIMDTQHTLVTLVAENQGGVNLSYSTSYSKADGSTMSIVQDASYQSAVLESFFGSKDDYTVDNVFTRSKGKVAPAKWIAFNPLFQKQGGIRFDSTKGVMSHDALVDDWNRKYSTPYSDEEAKDYHKRTFTFGFLAQLEDSNAQYYTQFMPTATFNRTTVQMVNLSVRDTMEERKEVLRNIVMSEVTRIKPKNVKIKDSRYDSFLYPGASSAGIDLVKLSERYKRGEDITSSVNKIIDAVVQEEISSGKKLALQMTEDLRRRRIESSYLTFALEKFKLPTRYPYKGKQRTLTEIDEIYSKFKGEKDVEYKNAYKQALEHILPIYIHHTQTGTWALSQLVYGNEASFKSADDLTKRIQVATATGKVATQDEIHGLPLQSNILVMNEDKAMLLRSLKELKDPKLRAAMESIEVDSSDGGGYVTPEFYEKLSTAYGADYGMDISIKPVYYAVGADGVPRALKYAVIVLTDELVSQVPILKNLRDTMYEKGVDQAVHESSVKVGIPSNLSSLNYNNGTVEFTPDSIFSIDNKFLRIQLNPSKKVDASTAYFSQIAAMMNTNGLNTGAEYVVHKLTSVLIDNGSEELDDMFRLTSKGTMPKGAIHNLVKTLLKQTQGVAGSEDIYSYLKAVSLMEKPALQLPLIKDKVIASLASKFTAATSGIRFEGSKFVIQAEPPIYENDTSNSPFKTPLQYRTEDGYCEALLPSTFRELYGIKDGDTISMNHPALTNGALGFRIPSSNYHSAAAITIKGFYNVPEGSEGNVIVLPSAVTYFMGSDNDIDSFFVARKSWIREKNDPLAKMFSDSVEALGGNTTQKVMVNSVWGLDGNNKPSTVTVPTSKKDAEGNVVFEEKHILSYLLSWKSRTKESIEDLRLQVIEQSQKPDSASSDEYTRLKTALDEQKTKLKNIRSLIELTAKNLIIDTICSNIRQDWNTKDILTPISFDRAKNTGEYAITVKDKLQDVLLDLVVDLMTAKVPTPENNDWEKAILNGDFLDLDIPLSLKEDLSKYYVLERGSIDEMLKEWKGKDTSSKGFFSSIEYQQQMHKNTFQGSKMTGVSALTTKQMGYTFASGKITKIKSLVTGEVLGVETSAYKAKFGNISPEFAVAKGFEWTIEEREEPMLKSTVTIGDTLFYGFTRNERLRGGIKGQNIFEIFDTIINLSIDNGKEQKLHVLGITDDNANAYMASIATGIPFNVVVKIFSSDIVNSIISGDWYKDGANAKGATNAKSKATRNRELLFTYKEINSLDKGQSKELEYKLAVFLSQMGSIGAQLFEESQVSQLLRKLPSEMTKLKEVNKFPLSYLEFKSANFAQFEKTYEDYIVKELVRSNPDKVKNHLEAYYREQLNAEGLAVVNKLDKKRAYALMLQNRIIRGASSPEFKSSDNNNFTNTNILSIPHLLSIWKVSAKLEKMLTEAFTIYSREVSNLTNSVLLEDLSLPYSRKISEKSEIASEDFLRMITSSMSFPLITPTGDTRIINLDCSEFNKTNIKGVVEAGYDIWYNSFIDRIQRLQKKYQTNKFLWALDIEVTKDSKVLRFRSNTNGDALDMQLIKEAYMDLLNEPLPTELGGETMENAKKDREDLYYDLFKFAILYQNTKFSSSTLIGLFSSEMLAALGAAYDQQVDAFIDNTQNRLTQLRLKTLKPYFALQFAMNNPGELEFPNGSKVITGGTSDIPIYSGSLRDEKGKSTVHYDVSYNKRSLIENSLNALLENSTNDWFWKQYSEYKIEIENVFTAFKTYLSNKEVWLASTGSPDIRNKFLNSKDVLVDKVSILMAKADLMSAGKEGTNRSSLFAYNFFSAERNNPLWVADTRTNSLYKKIYSTEVADYYRKAANLTANKIYTLGHNLIDADIDLNEALFNPTIASLDYRNYERGGYYTLDNKDQLATTFKKGDIVTLVNFSNPLEYTKRAEIISKNGLNLELLILKDQSNFVSKESFAEQAKSGLITTNYSPSTVKIVQTDSLAKLAEEEGTLVVTSDMLTPDNYASVLSNMSKTNYTRIVVSQEVFKGSKEYIERLTSALHNFLNVSNKEILASMNISEASSYANMSTPKPRIMFQTSIPIKDGVIRNRIYFTSNNILEANSVHLFGDNLVWVGEDGKTGEVITFLPSYLQYRSTGVTQTEIDRAKAELKSKC